MSAAPDNRTGTHWYWHTPVCGHLGRWGTKVIYGGITWCPFCMRYVNVIASRIA